MPEEKIKSKFHPYKKYLISLNQEIKEGENVFDQFLTIRLAVVGETLHIRGARLLNVKSGPEGVFIENEFGKLKPTSYIDSKALALTIGPFGSGVEVLE